MTADTKKTILERASLLPSNCFTLFLRIDLNGTNTIPDDVIRTTTRYMKASSAIYSSKDKRRAALTPILNKILCVNAQMLVNDDTDGVVELLLAAGPIFILLKKDKNGFGEGGLDPSTQAGLSIGRSWAQPKVCYSHHAL